MVGHVVQVADGGLGTEDLADGRVEAVAEGDRRAVEGFIEDLRRGPGGAVVRTVETQWEGPEGTTGFVIR